MNHVFLVSLGLDAAVLAIVGHCAYAAARKGFLRTVAQMATYFVIVFIASAVSRAAAPLIYDRLVEPMLFGDAPMRNAFLASVRPPGLMASAPRLLEMLPKSIDLEYWLQKAQEGMGGVTEEFLDGLMESTIRPAAVQAISALCFTVLFAALSAGVHIFLSAAGVVKHIPVIGPLNSLLGAAVGAVEGLLLAFLLALFLRGMLTLGQGEWWFFTEQAAQKSWIFRYFFDPSLLAALLQR